MFKQIPLTMSKALTTKQKFRKLITYIGGGQYMEKSTKGLPPLRRPKLDKKHKIRTMVFKIFLKLISGGMIGNSNYIGTMLNGLIQEVK